MPNSGIGIRRRQGGAIMWEQLISKGKHYAVTRADGGMGFTGQYDSYIQQPSGKTILVFIKSDGSNIRIRDEYINSIDDVAIELTSSSSSSLQINMADNNIESLQGNSQSIKYSNDDRLTPDYSSHSNTLKSFHDRLDHKNIQRMDYIWPDFDHIRTRVRLVGSKNDYSDWNKLYQSFEYALKQGELNLETKYEDRIKKLLIQAKRLRIDTGIREVADIEALLNFYMMDYVSALKILCSTGRINVAIEIWASIPHDENMPHEITNIILKHLQSETQQIACLLSKYSETIKSEWITLSRFLILGGIPISTICYTLSIILRKDCDIIHDEEKLTAPADELLLEYICDLANKTCESCNISYLFELHGSIGKIIDNSGDIIQVDRSTSIDKSIIEVNKLEIPFAVTYSRVIIRNKKVAYRLSLTNEQYNNIESISLFIRKVEENILQNNTQTVDKTNDFINGINILKSYCKDNKNAISEGRAPSVSTQAPAQDNLVIPRTQSSLYNQAKTIHLEGNKLRKLGNEEEASIRFMQAEKLFICAIKQNDQSSISAIKDLVSFYQQMHRFNDALKVMEDYKVMLSNDITSYRNILLTIYLNLKDFKKCLDIALEIYTTKQTTTLQSHIGYYYSRLSKNEEAIGYWKLALTNRSCSITQRYNVLQMLGHLYIRMQDIQNATSILYQLKSMPNTMSICMKLESAINDLNSGILNEEAMSNELDSENDVSAIEDESVDANTYELELLRRCDFDGIPGNEIEQGDEGLRYWKPANESNLKSRISAALRDARKGAVNLGTRSKRTLTAARCYKDWYDETKDQRFLVKYSQFLSESLFFRAQKEISVQSSTSKLDFICFLLRESIIFLSKSVTNIFKERDFLEAVGCLLSIRTTGKGQMPYDPSKDNSEKYFYNCLQNALSQDTDNTILELTWIDRCLAYSHSHSNVRRTTISSINKYMQENKGNNAYIRLVEIFGSSINEITNGFSAHVKMLEQEYSEIALLLQRISSEILFNYRDSMWIESVSLDLSQVCKNKQQESLDKERIMTCVELTKLLNTISVENDYDLQIRTCDQAINKSSLLINDILNEESIEKSTPTLLSLQSIHIFALGLQSVFRKMKAEIYQKYEPDLKLSDMLEAEGTVISQTGDVLIQLYMRNSEMCTPARDVRITFIIDEEVRNYYTIEEKDRTVVLKESIQQNCGESIQVKVHLFKNGLKADALQLSYIIDFITINGESKRIPSKSNQTIESITIKLKSDAAFVQIRNPYITGNPVSGNMFIGREKEVAQITETIKNGENGLTYIIYGQMRTGKTSLLNAIEDRLHDGHCLVVEAPAINGVENIYGYVKELLEALERVLPDNLRSCINTEETSSLWQNPAPLSVLTSIFSRLKKSPEFSDIKLVLTCDEFQYVYSHILRGTFPQNFMSVWKRWMHEIVAFSAVLVGNDAMHRFIERFSNDFAAMNTLRITYLDKLSSEKLIKEPVLWNNDGILRNRYIYNSLEWIYQLTKGSAFHIQHICSRLVERMNYETHQNSITEDDVNAAIVKLFTDVDYHSLFHMLYQSGEHALFPDQSVSDDDNKALLDVMARLKIKNRPINRQSLLGMVNDENIHLNSSVDQIINDLLLRGVILMINGEFSIVIELYYEYMKWKEVL